LVELKPVVVENYSGNEIRTDGWKDGQRQNYIPLPIPSAGDKNSAGQDKEKLVCKIKNTGAFCFVLSAVINDT
jgi:hypothetical protein